MTLTPIDRRWLGQKWIEAGLGEHASVAAFARFVLDLMSLGAPPDFLLDAIHAMEDEVEHARLCFGVARYIDGVSAGPGPLPAPNVRENRDAATILRSVILEGCIEETIAGEYAREARDRVEDPQIGEALKRIAADEARHAELSWRFVAWLLQTHPELQPKTEETFALGMVEVEQVEVHESAKSESYGHLLTASRKRVRDATITHIIRPRALALSGVDKNFRFL